MDERKKQMIEAYKERVTDAEDLWVKARKFGDRFHYEMELVMRGLVEFGNEHPFYNEMVHWKEVSLSEQTMWSLKVGVAGTCDGLVKLPNGSYRLIDFKTTMKPKKREYCYDYAIQLGIYRLMIEDLFGIEVEDAQILMLHYDIDTGKTIQSQIFYYSHKQI
ncbi:MAG: PD-(D/E)XK nuclease family protein, partial [Waterburya sp.]